MYEAGRGGQSAATRIDQTATLRVFLPLQLLARLEARQCLKDIEARLFPKDAGPVNGEKPATLLLALSLLRSLFASPALDALSLT